MTRIKIEDLQVNEEMSEQELKGIFGGFNPQPEPPLKSFGFHRVRRGLRGAVTSLDLRGVKVTYNKLNEVKVTYNKIVAPDM